MKCIQLVRDEGAVDAIHVATINVEALGRSMINGAMTIDTCNSKWQSYSTCSNRTQQISEKSGLLGCDAVWLGVWFPHFKGS